MLNVISRTIGVGLYGMIAGGWGGGGGGSSGGIPYRLIVLSSGGILVESEDTSADAGSLCSDEELYGEFQDDGLVIYYEAEAYFSLETISRAELISHGGA